MTSFARRTLMVVAMFCATSAIACSTPEADLCEAKVNCEGAADADLENEVCLLDADANAEIAELRGCGELYDQTIDCYAEPSNHFCDNVKFKKSDTCKDLFDRLDKCVGDPTSIDLND